MSSGLVKIWVHDGSDIYVVFSACYPCNVVYGEEMHGTFKLLLHNINKSTQKAQTLLAEAAHYSYIAWVPSSPNIHR